MTMLDSVREMQTRYLDTVKSTQEQLVSYNERIADTVVGALPDWQSPFSEYLPKPTEVVDTYFGYLGDLYEANKDFATRIAKAWDRAEVTED
jgi:hypothetical protein